MYLHQVLCQCTCLVGTDDGDGTHGFASVHLTHQVVGFQHTTHVQCQAEGNAHRQAFGHGHHNQGDGHHEVLQDDAGNVHPFLPTGDAGHGQVLVEVFSCKDKKGKDGDGETYLLDELGQLRELDVQWGFFAALFSSLGSYLADFGGIAHSVHLHDAMAIGYGGATHHFVAWVSRFIIERGFVGGLVHHQFTCESRFVDLQGDGFQQSTVGRHFLAGVQNDNIANHHFLSWNFLNLSISTDGDGCFFAHRI